MSCQKWVEVRDGDVIAMALFRRHYSYRKTRDQLGLFGNPNATLFVGPGEKLVLLTPCGKALFVWRKFRSMDNQGGVNCAVFRNEGAGRSSDLILAAERIAWVRWPGERFYTYVNPRQVRSANPGYCFWVAGWRKCGITSARKLLIFEKFAGSESDPSRSTTSACTGEGKTTPDGCKMSARRPSVVDQGFYASVGVDGDTHRAKVTGIVAASEMSTEGGRRSTEPNTGQGQKPLGLKQARASGVGSGMVRTVSGCSILGKALPEAGSGNLRPANMSGLQNLQVSSLCSSGSEPERWHHINDLRSITHHKGAVSPVAVKVRDRGMASGLSRDEWPDGTGGGSQELGGGPSVVAVKRSAAFNSDMPEGETPKAAALIESRAENRLAPASFRRAA